MWLNANDVQRPADYGRRIATNEQPRTMARRERNGWLPAIRQTARVDSS